MNLEPFNGRELPRIGDRVRVYRNLHHGGYSLMVGGHVAAHADRVHLVDVTFSIREGGRRRALKTGIRNVHAFALGMLAAWSFPGFASLVMYKPALGWVSGGLEPVAGCSSLWLSDRAYASGIRYL